MRKWMWSVAVVTALAGRAHADVAPREARAAGVTEVAGVTEAGGVTIDGFVVDGVISEGEVVYADRVVPHAIVRVVGERVVVIARADARGHIHVTGLPAGTYRVELEHGALAAEAPHREPRNLTIDDRRAGIWCNGPPTTRTFPSVLGAASDTDAPGARTPAAMRRPFIDTSSSALVTVFDGH